LLWTTDSEAYEFLKGIHHAYRSYPTSTSDFFRGGNKMLWLQTYTLGEGLIEVCKLPKGERRDIVIKVGEGPSAQTLSYADFKDDLVPEQN
jgi:hypothetical protein